MATKTKDQTSVWDSMEQVTADQMHLPRRGRGVGEDVLKIRETLEKCLLDGTIRAVPCEDTEHQGELTRKIRSASNIAGKEEIKISTRFDKATKKLYFGPAVNFDTQNK